MSNLTSGRSTSCGCATYLSKQPVGKIWDGIKSRCYTVTDKRYKNYGGRGIKMCLSWKNSREAFVNWALKTGYKKGMTIERKNNDKGYSPENCCWIPLEEQNRNKRNTAWVIYKGKKTRLAEINELNGFPRGFLGRRLARGLTLEEAITKPSQYRRILNGEKRGNSRKNYETHGVGESR
jgi:hypothetical protein